MNQANKQKLRDLVTSGERVPISPASKIEVCVLRVTNIPDSMKAYDLFDLLQSREKLQVLDIKIESKTINAAAPAQSDEKILPQFISQTPSVLFQIDKTKNKIDNIDHILQKMQLQGSCLKSEFKSHNLKYRLETMREGVSQASSVNLDYPAKFKNITEFLNSVVEMSKNPNRGDREQLLRERENYNSRGIFQILKNGAGEDSNFRLNDGNNRRNLSTSEKKSALVGVIGPSMLLAKIFNNKKLENDNNSHLMYIHYVGLRTNLNPQQRARYINLYQIKREVPCINVEFGAISPNSPKDFYHYWQLSTIKPEQVKEGINFVFLKLSGKPSKKTQIVFEMPEFKNFVKIEFSFKLCEKICYEKKEDGSIVLYFELTYSPRYAVMNYDDNQLQSHKFSEQWERVPHFGLDPEGDFLFNNYLTQSTIVRLTFPEESTHQLNDFLHVVKLVGVEVERRKQEDHFSLKDISQAIPYFTYKRLLSSKLHFEAKYALLSCLTQKKMNLYDISEDFLKLMEDDNEQNQAIVEKTLKDIASKNKKFKAEEKAESTDPSNKFFWDKYKQNKMSRAQWQNAKGPSHMNKTKRVTITPTLIIFNVEEAELSNSVLRRYKDNTEQFLRVTLSDEVGEGVKNMKYISETRFKQLLKGLRILNKTYHALAFSSSQLKNNSLWMFTENPTLSVRKIHEDIGDLSSILNPAKYAARLGQLFSASFAALRIDRGVITVEEIEDVKKRVGNNEYNFSDGVGKISMDLLDQIKVNMKIKGTVSAIQVRCGGVKGILVGDPGIGNKKICFRKSMIKFGGSSFENSLELLDYSKYRPGYLNRQIILLLLSNGLDPHVFLDMQYENIQDLEKKDNSDGNIFAYINNEHHLSPTKELLKDCVDAEVDINKEPFIKGVVDTIKVRSFINLKEKANILVKKGTRLTGVLDEYGVLKEDEIYVCLSPSNGENPGDLQIIAEDKVIITKNPCLHAGDIRILKAVNNDRVRGNLSHLVNCIVFPSKGTRPITDQISGSDLDGDMYFISWDPRLIPRPGVIDPMSYAGKKPMDKLVSMDAIVDFFIEFANNDVLGKIDNSHLALADESAEMARSKDCLLLAEIHAVAVDYAKTGVCPSLTQYPAAKLWPDFMEREPELTYESNSPLGEIYRVIRSEIEKTSVRKLYKDGSNTSIQDIKIDEDMKVAGFQIYLKEAFQALEEYYLETEALMNLYGIQTEFEIYSGNFLKFMSKGKNKKYNLEKLQEKMIEHIQVLKEKLLNMLIEGFDSERDIKDEHNNFTQAIRQKASAVYIAAYYNEDCTIEEINKAMVAAEYLTKTKPKLEKYGHQMIGLPWYVFKDVLLEIKKEEKRRRRLKN